MDFTNTASDAVADDDDLLARLPSTGAVMFRSRRPALQQLRCQTADLTWRLANSPVLPIDALLRRTNDKSCRITPRAPEVEVEPRFGLFKTVSAMRDRSGYRLRP